MIKRIIIAMLLLASVAGAGRYETLHHARRGRVTSELWTPADLTNAVSTWYDASTISGSGTITNWSDISGNNLALGIPAGAYTGPVVSNLNGKTSAYFAGTNQRMNETKWVTNAQPVWAWAAFVMPADGATDSDVMGAASPLVTMRTRWSGSGANTLIYAGSVATPRTRLLAGSYVWGVYFAGASSFDSLNGSTNAPYNPGANSIIRMIVGGSANSSSANLNANYGELLIIRGAMPPSDRQNVEGYLAHKWGLEDNLPADHPWKNQAPTK
jgi:hypothetical protein